ncbi:MAG: maleylpyruvate isomerase N-terminal domain-containing protein [Chloroflexi bacterium]|nr:maleylpyruvate isomerase N-terminal domain-containing protein [Chloroflexota bacterium]MDA1272085.1 maleylpyruvate isomerase N-terminal domain-containing protein [Chloroflexota bacterium]
MDTFQERAKLYKAESERFQGYLKGLPADAWGRQSACDEWLVADVVAHLVGNSEFYAGTVARGLGGESSAPEGRPEPGTGHPSISAAALAKSSIAARERLGDELLETYVEKDNLLINLLTGLSPEDQAKPCYHPGSIVPAGNFVDLRFKEVVLHEWDIRSAIEEKAGLSAASLASMVILINQSFASGSLRWAFWAGPPLDKPVRYRFEVKSPVPVTADIVVEGDKFRYDETPQGEADVTFRCHTHIFALLMYGRMAAAEAMAAGHLAVEGDVKLAERFSQWFKGI